MPTTSAKTSPRRRATTVEKELFQRFFQQVDRLIPRMYDDVVKVAHPTLKIAVIQHVRLGRLFNLAVLVTIVKTMLPDYAIPQEVTDFLAEQEEAVGQ